MKAGKLHSGVLASSRDVQPAHTHMRGKTRVVQIYIKVNIDRY